ncbi:MAG: hypothetical protein WC831_04335 [Parcubacteria group bacterium]|jgi:hypothetical protein
MNQKQELIKLINASNIEESDKKEWEILIGAAPEEYAGGLLELFMKFPDEIGWFTDIYKRKKQAFSMMESDKKKASEVLRIIFQEEKERLDELSKGADLN